MLYLPNKGCDPQRVRVWIFYLSEHLTTGLLHYSTSHASTALLMAMVLRYNINWCLSVVLVNDIRHLANKAKLVFTCYAAVHTMLSTLRTLVPQDWWHQFIWRTRKFCSMQLSYIYLAVEILGILSLIAWSDPVLSFCRRLIPMPSLDPVFDCLPCTKLEPGKAWNKAVQSFHSVGDSTSDSYGSFQSAENPNHSLISVKSQICTKLLDMPTCKVWSMKYKSTS